MENVVILGSGICGLTAAIYSARAELKPLVVGGLDQGGQLMLTTEVENFPGFPEGIQGPELISKAKKQAEKFGAKFKSGNATKIVKKDNYFEITINNEIIKTLSVIIATGASARWLEAENEEKYKGRGVSVCATCDGYFYKNKNIIVVGGGDSACEESLFLTRFASHVTLILRSDKFRASKIMQERVFANNKIEIIYNKQIIKYLGDENKITGVVLKDTITGEESEMKTDGVFLAIGHVPNTKNFADILKLDEKGYIIVDNRFRTNVEGIFAAGDVQDFRYRQAVTAAGTGCAAALEAQHYIEELKNKNN